MAKVISIINNKGGVAKTTSTAVIAELIASTGRKVLMIDLDQQSNLSMLFGYDVEDSENVINGLENPDNLNIFELFKYRLRIKEDVQKVIKSTQMENLYIIPSSRRHKNVQLVLEQNKTGNNNIVLKKALETIKEEYDYIIIDNAPANDILTVNSMFASDYIMVPVRTESFSYKGLLEILDTIRYIKEEHDLENVNFLGAFMTQVKTRTNVFKDIRENYRDELGGKFFETVIREDTKVQETETKLSPLLSHCSSANAVYDYAKLILEAEILDEEASNILKAGIEG